MYMHSPHTWTLQLYFSSFVHFKYISPSTITSLYYKWFLQSSGTKLNYCPMSKAKSFKFCDVKHSFFSISLEDHQHCFYSGSCWSLVHRCSFFLSLSICVQCNITQVCLPFIKPFGRWSRLKRNGQKRKFLHWFIAFSTWRAPPSYLSMWLRSSGRYLYVLWIL